MENKTDKIFCGYVKSVKLWDDSQRAFVEPREGVSMRFSLSVAEMNDLQRYATKGEKPFVSFDLKRSAKGSYYIEVSDPSTWTQRPQSGGAAPVAPQAPQAPVAGDDLPF
jgi:hypothetical protein